jgi:hypothetical protein
VLIRRAFKYVAKRGGIIGKNILRKDPFQWCLWKLTNFNFFESILIMESSAASIKIVYSEDVLFQSYSRPKIYGSFTVEVNIPYIIYIREVICTVLFFGEERTILNSRLYAKYCHRFVRYSMMYIFQFIYYHLYIFQNPRSVGKNH